MLHVALFDRKMVMKYKRRVIIKIKKYTKQRDMFQYDKL